MITINTLINGFIVLACMAYLGWRGYERGVIGALQRLLSTLSGYVVSYFFIGSVANFIEEVFSLHGLQSYLFSAVILFFGTAILVDKLLVRLIELLEEKEQEPAHVAGMIIGTILGCLFGFMTVWLSDIVVDAIKLRQHHNVARAEEPVRKIAGQLVGGVVGYTVEQKVGDNNLAPEIAAKLIGDPVGTSQQLVLVSKSDEVKQFFSDPSVQLLMQTNQLDKLQQHAAFQNLMNTPQTVEFLTILGTSVKSNDRSTKDERAARLLTDMYQKTLRVKSDPRFIALSQKPEYQEMVQNPSPVGLLTNPTLKELAEIVFSDKPATIDEHTSRATLKAQGYETLEKPHWEEIKLQPDNALSGVPVVEDKNVIYRWTDEYGQIHFGQKKPEGNYVVEVIQKQ